MINRFTDKLKYGKLETFRWQRRCQPIARQPRQTHACTQKSWNLAKLTQLWRLDQAINLENQFTARRFTVYRQTTSFPILIILLTASINTFYNPAYWIRSTIQVNPTRIWYVYYIPVKPPSINPRLLQSCLDWHEILETATSVCLHTLQSRVFLRRVWKTVAKNQIPDSNDWYKQILTFSITCADFLYCICCT